MMKNYTEKFLPSGEFDKSKVRVLYRGDLQFETANTEGPVCRVESIFLLFNIAVYYDLEVFKVDFVAAYLNTPMPPEVKHKWMFLDPMVSKRLIEREPELWAPFYRKDKRILVQLDKLLYGYKEAAHYWNKILIEMFKSDGWTIHKKDKCVVSLTTSTGRCMIAITVDDCTACQTRNSGLKERFYELCKRTFQDITVEEGDTIEVIGMTFELDRNERSVKVTQKRFITKIIEKYGIIKKSVSPSTLDLYEEDLNSPMLKDQLSFLSINSTAMFAGKRTYPEVLPVTTYLATKYMKATEQHFKKASRVLEYLHYYKDHCLYLRPKSLRIICAADASYAEHEDAKSHTGGCIGFEGYDGNNSYFIFISSKQPVVAKSSCEAEIIAADTVGNYFVWLDEFMKELKIPTISPAHFLQDNKSTIHLLLQGKGTFKRTKHIKVRFFWLNDLVEAEVILLMYTPSKEMDADILSKPLIGSQFRHLLYKILGWNVLPKELFGAIKGVC
jgi:hypothetical protein